MDGTHSLNRWRIVEGEGVLWQTQITWLTGQNFARGPRVIRTSSGCGTHFFCIMSTCIHSWPHWKICGNIYNEAIPHVHKIRLVFWVTTVLNLDNYDQASKANSKCRPQMKQHKTSAVWARVRKGKIKQQVLVECVHEPTWRTPRARMRVEVYLSMDDQQRRYWDDTVADVHKDILSTVQTLNSRR